MFGLSLMNTIFRQIIKFSDIVGSLSDFLCVRKKGWQTSVDPNQLAAIVMMFSLSGFDAGKNPFPRNNTPASRRSSSTGLFCGYAGVSE